MRLPENYRKPCLIAILVHVVVLMLLLFNFAASQFRAPPSSSPQKIIHATAIIQHSEQPRVPSVSEQKLSEQLRAQSVSEQKLQSARENHAKMLQLEKVETAKLQKLAALKASEAKKAAQEKQKKLLAQKTLKKEIEARALASAELAKQEKQKTLKALAKKNKLLAEQKKLQEQLMQQQLNSEQKNITQVQSLAQQGVIDKYKAQILATIQSNWRIDKVDSKLKCIYSIALAPNGDVLSINLVKSSGDTALDQSAQQAIQQSSPLPVPSNPSLFGNFRQLVLTLSPQGYLQNT